MKKNDERLMKKMTIKANEREKEIFIDILNYFPGDSTVWKYFQSCKCSIPYPGIRICW
jgi:hypothetical protein